MPIPGPSPSVLPTLQVLLDDVNNGRTFPHDITQYARARYSLSPRGTDDESSGPQAVNLDLVLVNTDGRFTLGSTSGGYGVINVDRGIRVNLTVDGATTSRFTGFVDSWPTAWPNATERLALSSVHAVDVMSRWAEYELRSIPEEEILRDAPDFYYTLGEPTGATSGYDSSGKNAPTLALVLAAPSDFGYGGPVPVFGAATGAGTDGLTAPAFTTSLPDNSTGGTLTTGLFPSGAPVWLEATFVSTDTDISHSATLAGLSSPAGGTINLGISGGSVRAEAFGTFLNTSSPIYADGRVHHAAVYVDAGTAYLLVDGVVRHSLACTPLSARQYKLSVGVQFTGTLCHVAGGFSTAGFAGTIPTRLASHAQAMLTGFDGESSDLRVKRFADYEASATGYAGGTLTTRVPFLEITGKSAAEAIQLVADAEQGVAFADGQGRATLRGRSAAGLKVTPDLVIATSSDMVDSDTTIEADKRSLINRVTGKRLTGSSMIEQTIEDATSRRVHGRRSLSWELLLFTDAEVLDRMSWVLATRKEPVPRLAQLTLDLLAADLPTQSAVMGLDVNSRIQIVGMPSQSATGTVADLVVRGYSEAMTPDSWTWSATVESWTALEQVWVLGDPTYGALGTTTRLGV